MKFDRLFTEKGLSMERLAALVEVDDAGGIANAAPDDDSRQSLISRQISQLEKFFDIELKNKTGKTVRLTPAGKHLAKLAREHLQSLEEFQRSCSKQPTEVVIGAGDSLLQWLVLPRIHKVREALQGSVVELQDLQNAAICNALQDHVIDFGLLRSDLVTRGSLTGKSLGKFGYSLFIPDKLFPRDKKRMKLNCSGICPSPRRAAIHSSAATWRGRRQPRMEDQREPALRIIPASRASSRVRPDGRHPARSRAPRHLVRFRLGLSAEINR